MRKLLGTLPLMASALVLAACEPNVPDRPGGVGFGDYQSYMAERASGQTGSAAPASGYGTGMGTGAGSPVGAPMNATDLQPAPLSTPVAGAAPSVSPGAPLPASILAAVNQVDGGGADTAGMVPTEVPSADLRLDPTGQNGGYTAPGQFAAASDVMSAPMATPVATPMSAPVAQARPAPVASGAKGAELVDYALAATNAVGQSVWERGTVKMANHERACAKYPGSDLAQAAFLKRGGPARDPLNLDPDGDGFACAWDPRPFQQARK
ncbi:hypothetical protein [Phaeovulum sp. W22_SRMD_FR3]|uniref:hypothetical protein n=1 Tax=Phaeovulum sp. W22_SRMD_FR3 TaxID=3240274 RepID=UPI003F979B9D